MVKKESACSSRCEFDPWVRKIPWRRKWQPTPVFLLRKSHGQRSLECYSPWGGKELDMTEQLSKHTHVVGDIRHKRYEFNPQIGKIPWRREWLPTPVSFPGEFHGQRSLAGSSPWDHKESDTTEQLTLKSPT